MGNIEYHQSVAERHLKLVLKFAYLKDLDDVEPFNISGVDRGKESEHGRGGVDVTTVITFKKPSVKHTTGNSIPRSRRRGGMKHHVFMVVTAYN